MAGIYIHVPFCKKICSYCDFYHVMAQSDNKQYINALNHEARLRRNYLGAQSVSTIYIGGGTPSVLQADEIKSILDNIVENFKIDKNPEVTIEVNPDDISDEFLEGLKKTMVNRISVGIQSWRDQDLSLMNRRHTASVAAMALEKIFDAAYENVTIDLMYGLPGMKTADWASNLDISFSYGIKHLSAYHLTIEAGTMLNRMKQKGMLTEIDEDESTSQFQVLIEKAEAAGFIQYEISNFSLPGFLSIHNSNYWKQVSYLGLGPSAHSFNGYSRQWNIRDVNKYIKAIESDSPLFDKEELDRKTRFNEYIMTSLRTMWGINLDYVEDIFDKEGYDYIRNLSGKFIDYGLMRQEKQTLVLTNQGKMISDNIISELMLPVGN
ncbi:MAG TPA: radical SAM family heme chaperone HemW [Bacteroidales bacterium]|nr:radical SAM family heme chaperone HemW [Bacteroidales bacterium]HNY52563.1 radical SAM family heme chaperone HemW [Bacteroidales bacterium]HOG56295.1 radical SAM family heme chaperone HemW [Bacteroidales bacterium]HPX43295.1 radical SAM family heme chaperone HemW [Bacteroidales bacterium]